MGGRQLSVAVLIAVAAVGCGESSEPEPRVDVGANETEETPSESPGYAYSDYDFTEFNPKGCYKKESLGAKSSVKIGVVPLTGAYPFNPSCLTDVKIDEVTVTLVSDNATHNMIVEGDDVELIAGPGEKASATFELADEPIVYFACTYHPAMVGAFFR